MAGRTPRSQPSDVRQTLRINDVKQPITSYRQDDTGDWIAELACGHAQHVRHSPPWELRPWVLNAQDRQAKLGTHLDCGTCDQSTTPNGAAL